jgi:hypothetical protein
MAYRMAGIDVHKKKLAVVVADVEVEDEYQFERRWYGSNPEQLRLLSEWLIEQRIEEVVMESTAQYWKPVWGALERYWKPRCYSREDAGRMSGTLHFAQALSNRGRRGRKNDFRDAGELSHRFKVSSCSRSAALRYATSLRAIASVAQLAFHFCRAFSYTKARSGFRLGASFAASTMAAWLRYNRRSAGSRERALR